MTITNRVSLKSVMAGVTPIDDVPDAPSIGAATNVGTSRAFNNGSATVAYTTAATGGTPTTFTATSTPGSYTGTGASPITVAGLQSATSYTFAVSAANANGTQTSAASSTITATTVGQAPTIGTFTDGGTGTTGALSFTAGATGGSAITNYKYSTDSSTYTALSPAVTTSPLPLIGLTSGTYNFSLKSVNANGDSAASSVVSGTVITPSSFESIATLTAAGGETSLTFSSIPSTYKHLQVRWIARSTGYAEYIFGRANATGGYANHSVAGNGSSVSAAGSTSNTYIQMHGGVCQNTAPASTFGAGILDIIDYASTTKNKTFRYFVGYDTNGAVDQRVQLGSALGTGITTAAITSLDFRIDTGNFAAGSTFSLYGIKA